MGSSLGCCCFTMNLKDCQGDVAACFPLLAQSLTSKPVADNTIPLGSQSMPGGSLNYHCCCQTGPDGSVSTPGAVCTRRDCTQAFGQPGPYVATFLAWMPLEAETC